MQATFTDEQHTLAQTARDLAEGGLDAARRLLGPPDGDGDAEPPAEPTASLLGGFGGLGISPDRGGAGGGLVDLAILLEGLGRQVVPTPFVSHVLATHVADAAGLDVATAAAGERRLALAVEERTNVFGTWETRVADGRLAGRKVAVRDGASADAAVVVTADGVAVATPAELERRDPFDPTRPVADLAFDGEVEASAADAPDAVYRAVAALAAELVGVGRGAVDLAVDYAKVREQFGQVIGRFQGVAHQLSDAWAAVENAWSLTLYACWAIGAGDPDGIRAVHAAKSAAGDAGIHAAERCTQVHGGTGITWEANPHLYLRRAIADDAWLGNARWHRQQVGTSLLAG